MKRDYEALKEYSFVTLFTAAIRKLFGKKAFRLTASAAAFLIFLIIMDYIRANHTGGIWYADFWLYLIPFAVFTASGAYFISNIGRFSERKFCVSAIVIGVLLWTAASVHDVILMTAFEETFGWWIGLCFLKRIPLLMTSMTVVLLPVVIKSRCGKVV